MKIALDNNGAVNLITAYEPGLVRIRGREFNSSLIVFPDHLLTGWAPRVADDLCPEHLQGVIERRPELLILGTGELQVFPDPAHFVVLMDERIGFEVMDNAAACRTYNILLAEGRNAALGLILADAN